MLGGGVLVGVVVPLGVVVVDSVGLLTVPVGLPTAYGVGDELGGVTAVPAAPAAPATPPVPVVGAAVGFGDGPMFCPIALPLTTNSTRRFNCLPVAVLLEAIGSDSANPRAPTLPDETPWLIRKSRTESARLSESL